MRLLALIAVVPAGATLYFAVFWTWFAWWRRHRVRTYVLMLGTLAAVAVAVTVQRDWLLTWQLELPVAGRVIGWVVVAAAMVLGGIADRQIGIRVRSFAPFFDERGRIELVTTGAYGLVRHPIYAAGIGFQVGVFLATGDVAVACACLVFAIGALWFTRQEERRLVALLEDPGAYERYRARVPALLPWPR